MSNTTLSSVDRTALELELRQQQAEINRKLELLGISPQAESSTEQRYAPDGGPVSSAHRFLAPQTVPTMSVRLKGVKGDAGLAIIAREDFDETLHERIAEPRLVLKKQEPSSSNVSAHTRNELLTMTVANLRALPETASLDEIPDKKEELVTAILQVREALLSEKS